MIPLWSRLPLLIFSGVALLAAPSAGCEARFSDLRPADRRHPPDAGASRDGGGGEDASPATDAGVPADAGAPVDAGTKVLSQGMFEGRAGHFGSGTARLVERDGALRLELLDDFDVQSVPGPVVVLSMGDTLGTSIDAADGEIQLAELISSTGAQSYAVPPEAGGAAYAWVYCLPFGVEVARAPLEPLP